MADAFTQQHTYSRSQKQILCFFSFFQTANRASNCCSCRCAVQKIHISHYKYYW